MQLAEKDKDTSKSKRQWPVQGPRDGETPVVLNPTLSPLEFWSLQCVLA